MEKKKHIVKYSSSTLLNHYLAIYIYIYIDRPQTKWPIMIEIN